MVCLSLLFKTRYRTSFCKKLLFFISPKVRCTHRPGIAVKVDGNAGSRAGIDGRGAFLEAEIKMALCRVDAVEKRWTADGAVHRRIGRWRLHPSEHFVKCDVESRGALLCRHHFVFDKAVLFAPENAVAERGIEIIDRDDIALR